MADTTLCIHCSRMGRTCCQQTQVFLTQGDIRRIRESLPDEEFTEFAEPDEPAATDLKSPDDAWAEILSAGRRRVLGHRTDGSCHFLTEKGCRLPLPVRPLICRLYPYEYDENTIKGVNPHLCPEPERNNPALLLALLGMNRTEAEEWRRLFYREMREDLAERR